MWPKETNVGQPEANVGKETQCWHFAILHSISLSMYYYQIWVSLSSS